MDSPTQNSIEKKLARAGRDFNYPTTPDIAARVMQQLDQPVRARTRWRRGAAWAAGLLILVIAILLAVPPVRAQILEFLQFGAIRIFLSTPTPTPTVLPTQTAIPGTLTPAPSLTSSPTPSLLDLGGETTLAQAQQETNFPILLPAYPADLGPPDKVYFQPDRIRAGEPGQ